MPLAFHSDRNEMFRQQAVNSEKYVFPFIQSVMKLKECRILEIGCGEGGVLKPFLRNENVCYGVDLNTSKIQYAREAADHRALFFNRDIYDPELIKEFHKKFDLILLMNTIEHIPDSGKLVSTMKHLCKDRGMMFIAFPPWFMPYAGHQQMARSRLAKLPYYHLLPKTIYKHLLKLMGEDETKINNLLSIADTRVTIQGFEKLIRRCGCQTIKKQLYLINPIYKVKFGLKAVKQLPVIRSVPWLRDFFTTTCYYLIQPR